MTSKKVRKPYVLGSITASLQPPKLIEEKIEARCRIDGETTTYYDGNDALEFNLEHTHVGVCQVEDLR